MAIIGSPGEVQFDGLVMGEEDGQVFGAMTNQVHEVDFYVFYFFLALGDRGSHKSEALAVARHANLSDTQRSTRNRDCAGRGVGIALLVGEFPGAEVGMTRQGVGERDAENHVST